MNKINSFFRLIHFIRDGHEVNLSIIDKYLSLSWNRFEIYSRTIINKRKRLFLNFLNLNIIDTLSIDLVNIEDIVSSLQKNKEFKNLNLLPDIKYIEQTFKYVLIRFNLKNNYLRSLKLIEDYIYNPCFIKKFYDLIQKSYDRFNDYLKKSIKKFNNLIFFLYKKNIKFKFYTLKNNEIFLKKQLKKKNLDNKIFVNNTFEKKKKKDEIFNKNKITKTTIHLFQNKSIFLLKEFIDNNNFIDINEILLNDVPNIFDAPDISNDFHIPDISINKFCTFNVLINKFYINDRFNYCRNYVVNKLMNLKFSDFRPESFNILIFSEIYFLCSVFLFNSNLSLHKTDIYELYFNIIKKKKKEIFNFVEYMCFFIFKKEYRLKQIQLSTIILKFLNVSDFFKYYFLKYFNLNSNRISRSFMGFFNFDLNVYDINNSLNQINSNVELFDNKYYYSLNSTICVKLVKNMHLKIILNFFVKSFKWMFKNAYHVKSIIVKNTKILEEDLTLVKTTPFKSAKSLPTLIDEFKTKSKRGRPRKLTIYQRQLLQYEGVLEPEKPLTKAELFEEEWGVPYKFAQEHPKYMEEVKKIVERRELKQKLFQEKLALDRKLYYEEKARKEQGLEPEIVIVEKPKRGRPRKNKIVVAQNDNISDNISDNVGDTKVSKRGRPKKIKDNSTMDVKCKYVKKPKEIEVDPDYFSGRYNRHQKIKYLTIEEIAKNFNATKSVKKKRRGRPPRPRDLVVHIERHVYT